jgi:hypothetical protein
MPRHHMTPSGPVPFSASEEAEWDAREAIASEELRLKNLNDYQIKRAIEYPDFKDYLDGVVKQDQAQVDSYTAACLAVKAKYPKPV